MSKKALGKGVAALFPTEQHELEDSSNLEVISNNLYVKTMDLEVNSANLEPHNKEDTSSKLKDITNNLDVKTKSLEVRTTNSEVKSSNLEEITYNLEVMKEALADAKQNPRISLWSPRSATVLRYLRKTKPEFSISEEAGLLLEDAIMRKYPDLYERTKKEQGSN
jgi:hypothetical protein